MAGARTSTRNRDVLRSAVQGGRSLAKPRGVMAHETPEKSTRRILLADDDAQTRLSLEYILEAARYEVSVAEDGAAALALLDDLSERGVAVDLVITDLQMPELDGLAVIHGVRARQPELPSIVITGSIGPVTE